MDPIISLIVFLIIIGVIMWGVGRLPIAEPFRTVAYVVVVIAVVVYVANWLSSTHLLRMH